jgi:Ca2+-binding RTX toxin-like protein
VQANPEGVQFGPVDRLFGDSGVDTLDYGAFGTGVTVQLAGWVLANGPTPTLAATFTGIENVVGSDFADALIGDAGDNRITGGGNPDWLVGGAGNDTFVQGIESGGADTIFGDAGTDALDYSSASAGVIVQLSGYATVNGGALLATFTGIEDAIGSIHDDALIGNASANRLTGGIGDDWLVGGAGPDTFVYRAANEGVDTIADFSRTDLDKIDLSAIDADPTEIGDQSFAFSMARTSGLAGEAVATTFASSTLISLYLDTDNVADMVLQIIHQPGLVMNANDFVL